MVIGAVGWGGSGLVRRSSPEKHSITKSVVAMMRRGGRSGSTRRWQAQTGFSKGMAKASKGREEGGKGSFCLCERLRQADSRRSNFCTCDWKGMESVAKTETKKRRKWGGREREREDGGVMGNDKGTAGGKKNEQDARGGGDDGVTKCSENAKCNEKSGKRGEEGGANCSVHVFL